MSFFQRCGQFLGGEDSLRPLDYMMLLAILMITAVRFIWG